VTLISYLKSLSSDASFKQIEFQELTVVAENKISQKVFAKETQESFDVRIIESKNILFIVSKGVGIREVVTVLESSQKQIPFYIFENKFLAHLEKQIYRLGGQGELAYEGSSSRDSRKNVLRKNKKEALAQLPVCAHAPQCKPRHDCTTSKGKLYEIVFEKLSAREVFVKAVTGDFTKKELGTYFAFASGKNPKKVKS